MKFEELKDYNLSMSIAEECWNDIKQWDVFSKNTIGNQLIRAIDSVAANLSEEYGRFHYIDSKRVGYFSGQSLFESKTWLTKAKNRGLISEKRFLFFSEQITITGKILNKYINAIGRNEINDPFTDYSLNSEGKSNSF